MTGARKEDVIVLEKVLCIHNLVKFWKENQEITKSLINSGNEINAMTLAFAKQLGLQIRLTNFGAQKIDGLSLKTFGIIIARFQIEDKFGKARFF